MEFISFHLPHNRISWNSVWKHGNAWQSFSESGCLISFMFCIALQISNIYDHRISSKESKWKEVFVCNFFFLNDYTVPLSISTFVFNHRISAMMFLTGNFLNASDRDGLRGRPLDPMLLSASDKTRCKLSGSSASEAVASS